MRLWTVHPKYLDTQGLTGLWREGLLAQAVLAGQTSGYRSHPQLTRFKSSPDPLGAIAQFLSSIYEEAKLRGYRFDRGKINDNRADNRIQTTRGQLAFEWQHLLLKLEKRSPEVHQRVCPVRDVDPNPLFEIIPGDVEPWEKR
ncbi:MAG: pyrimidine dimer DNA glycosylase/endonuclease V [Anaerolineales bacterium]|nr:pyrimidine dimer DNA glycosylase/endonuclease V [Anaerolineales bacterium]